MKTQKIMSVFSKRVAAITLAFTMLCSVALVSAGAAEQQTPSETVVAKPTASVKPGLCREAQQVTLTAEEGAKIYYTTNHLMPTENDTEYTAPITVSEDTNICAIAVKNGVKSVSNTFGYLIRGAETPQMQFVVMSDIHIGDGLNIAGGGANVYDLDKARTFKAMEVMSNIFPNPDLLVMNGDLVKHNTNSSYPSKEADHSTFINLMKDSMKEYGMENTPVQLTIGNHDSQNHNVANMKAYYDKDTVAKDWFPSDTGYYHKEVKGLDFIYLDSNHTTTAQKDFLSATLAEIQEKKGENSPIFVFLHIPIKGTLDDDSWTCSADWKNILADYPQAIVFSGHTHYTVSEDCSISQEAGFTAVNDGCMSYIERIDSAKEMMWNSTDGTLKKAYQFPVTQGLAIEVYDDRVEINRITVNGDRGDVKVNDYVPKEPFDNCGAIAGEKWVIRRGDTTADWKSNFSYTKAQRKANDAAPVFADNVKPTLSGSGRTAVVSFPQAENARRVDRYQIELVNEATGKTDKTMKVWSENVFTPMPESLSYDISDLAAETTYRAKVTAYNVYGAASEGIVSEETFTTASIPGRKPEMIANEGFSSELTEADHATTIIPYATFYSSANVMGEGEVRLSSGRDGLATWHTSNNGGNTLNIPFAPGTTVTTNTDGVKKYNSPALSGEFIFEFDLEQLSAVSNQGISYYFRNADGSKSTNIAKLTVNSVSSNLKLDYYTASTGSSLATYATSSFRSGAHKIRLLLGTDDGVQYLGGLWIDGNAVKTTKQPISARPGADGWRGIGAEPTTTWVAGDLCTLDNIKVWRPTANQLKELIAEGNDLVSFEQIKGANTTADNVTENLNLSSLIGTQTASGLVVTGWQSDKENVIATDGTVTRPSFAGDASTVTLTPLLGMVNSLNEGDGDYVTAAGAPIIVTVPDQNVKPLEIAQTKDIANETFTDELSEEDFSHTVIPFVTVYKNVAADAAEMQLTSGETGSAKWVANVSGKGHNMHIPFSPGTQVSTAEDGTKNYTVKPLSGEFYIEFDLNFLSALAGKGAAFYIRNGSGKNIANLNIKGTQVLFQYYRSVSGKDTLTSYATTTISGNSHKLKLLLGTENEVQYLGGLWIDGTAVKTAKQLISDYPNAEGWAEFAVSPNTASWVQGEHCTIDNIRVWRSDENQAKELAAAEGGKITFEQIKGGNNSADNITEKLDLKSGETAALQTANKMLVMGWKSDHPEIISESGELSRPLETVEVLLTPILVMQNATTGAYITTDGAPIAVKVRGQRVGFYDAASAEVTCLNAAITQGRANISDLSGPVTAIAALYQDGRLKQTWTGQRVTAGENAMATVDIVLPADLTGKTLKLFVWNADTLQPLCGEAEVN